MIGKNQVTSIIVRAVIAAGDCDAGVFMPHQARQSQDFPHQRIISIPPGFPGTTLVVFISFTGRTVSPGTTLNALRYIFQSSGTWFVSNKPVLRSPKTEISVSVLMFEDRTATADDICPLVNSQTV